MSNLTPELRPDKNGKLVTRHVRTESGTKSSTPMPAPMMTTADKTPVFHMVEKKLSDVLASARSERVTDFDEWDEEDNEWKVFDESVGYDADALLQDTEISEALSALPASTLQSIWDQSDNNPYSDDLEVSVLHALTFERDDVQSIEYLVHLHNKASGYYPGEDLLENPDVNSYTILRDHVHWLRGFERVGYTIPEHPYEASANDWAVMDGLFTVQGALNERKAEFDDNLARLVIERPDSALRVAEIIEQRNTTDESLIRNILDSEAPSIAEGFL